MRLCVLYLYKDANATSIEIKLCEYGFESIEVIDNGEGIGRENFESLVLRHHTSKIKQFEDIERISSYGFRYVPYVCLYMCAFVPFYFKSL